MNKRPSYLSDQRATVAVEFALVFPALLYFLLGIVDVGRFLWSLDMVEKATERGARFAVVTDPVASVLTDDFALSHGSNGGDPVSTATFDKAVCTNTGNCTVTGSVSASNGRNATAFTNMVTWMQKYDPQIQPSNVTITYKNVGLGFAGDPNGPDVAALTTVTVSGMTFRPAVLFGGSFTLPSVDATLTLEDAQGTDSN